MPFVSRREKNAKKLENIFKMSAPIPHIEPIPHGRNFLSNPDIRNWRSNSAHIRHFDQSQSYESFEHRPVGSVVFHPFIISIHPDNVCNRYHRLVRCRTDYVTVWMNMTHRDHAVPLHYPMEPFKFVLEMV